MDSTYLKNTDFKINELPHHYGDSVHLLSDPMALLGLGKLCSPECQQPQIHYWVLQLYKKLLHQAVNSLLPKKQKKIPTRMHFYHPKEGVFHGLLPHLDSDHKIIIANLIRAGTIPSFLCFDELNYYFNPKQIRQDHIVMERELDKVTQKVTGTKLNASKLGGSIDNSWVFFPDPMGATGSTVKKTIESYKDHGSPIHWVALHLIITPEYIRKLKPLLDSRQLSVFALRIDRSLSPKHVLESEPGQFLDQEQGLNEKDYIVPGAGGLGELINNTDF